MLEQLPLNLAAVSVTFLCTAGGTWGGRAVGGLQPERSDVILSSGDSLQSRKRSPSGCQTLRLRNIFLLEGALLPVGLSGGA